MKIYAGLHGDMQKPRIKSRGGNMPNNMSKFATIESVKPLVDNSSLQKGLNMSKTMSVISVKVERIGDFVALLRSNPQSVPGQFREHLSETTLSQAAETASQYRGRCNA